MRRLIFVEGNVGSGKTSALNHLAARLNSPGTVILREPVENWRNVNGHNILDLMYKNPEKYGFSFQCYVFISRMQQILNSTGDIIIAERSIFTDRYVFLESLFRLGKITDAEKEIYNTMWDFWTGIFESKLTNFSVEFLYIKCAPEKCFDHVQKRDRKEENGIELSYLQILGQTHDELYGKKELFWSGPRQITIIENHGTPDFFDKIFDFFA